MSFMFTPSPSLNYEICGAGTPVVLLHGTAGTGQQWRGLAEHLQNRFQVVMPDLPGYGRSAPIDCGAAPTLKELAVALNSLLSQFDRPVHLVGHSFGGALALKAASLYQEQIQSLTLIEPAAFNVLWTERGMHCDQTAAFCRAIRNAKNALNEGDAWGAMEIFIDFWNGTGAWARSSFKLKQDLSAQIAQCFKDISALSADRMGQWDISGVVCPVHLITGTQSPPEMQAIAQLLCKSIPFCAHSELIGAGHLLHLTDPHLSHPLIGNFLVKADSKCKNDMISEPLAA